MAYFPEIYWDLRNGYPKWPHFWKFSARRYIHFFQTILVVSVIVFRGVIFIVKSSLRDPKELTQIKKNWAFWRILGHTCPATIGMFWNSARSGSFHRVVCTRKPIGKGMSYNSHGSWRFMGDSNLSSNCGCVPTQPTLQLWQTWRPEPYRLRNKPWEPP